MKMIVRWYAHPSVLAVAVLMSMVVGLRGQDTSIARWRAWVGVGTQSTTFYDSDVGRDFTWNIVQPFFGVGLGYRPKLRWEYEGQLYWQVKQAKSVYGLQYTLYYVIGEASVNYGLFSRRLDNFILRWLYEGEERPMKVWTYAGVGYYGGYLVDHKKELWVIDEPNLRYVDHGLVLRAWNVFYFGDGRRDYWTVSFLFSVYIGFQRVLDFKTFAFTETVLFYPQHLRVCYVW